MALEQAVVSIMFSIVVGKRRKYPLFFGKWRVVPFHAATKHQLFSKLFVKFLAITFSHPL